MRNDFVSGSYVNKKEYELKSVFIHPYTKQNAHWFHKTYNYIQEYLNLSKYGLLSVLVVLNYALRYQKLPNFSLLCFFVTDLQAVFAGWSVEKEWLV